MNLKIGIADESFKACFGSFSTSPKLQPPSYDHIFNRDSIMLIAAKRDRAVFQAVIQASEDMTVSIGRRPAFSEIPGILNLRISVEPDSPDLKDIDVYHIGYAEDDDRTMKADMLLQDEVVTVRKNILHCVWIEIRTPEAIECGVYSGRVNIYGQRMFEDEVLYKTLTFRINIRNVLLPESRNYRFHLGLWQHLSNIARKHEVILWSDEHFKILEHYVKSLAELGQKAISIIASEIPWSGQGCFRVTNYPSNLFEFNMVRIYKDGTFTYDFSVIERYVKLCFKYGIDKEIEVLGLICIWKYEAEGYSEIAEDYPDAIRIRYLDRSDGKYKYMRKKHEILAYFKALENYFIEKGWIDKVRIVADEPHDKKLYNDVLAFLKEHAPKFRYKAAINHADFIEESKDKLEDYVPYLPAVANEWNRIQSMRDDIKGRLLWYVCCEPLYPNTFISSPLAESRLIGPLTAWMNFDGFLRWNYTVWPEQPRKQISYNYPLWFAGDTNFVYPSYNGRPLLTLRYKALKRGIEDFELISLLRERRADSNEVLKEVWKCIFKAPDITGFYQAEAVRETLYSLEHEDYERAKRLLLSALEEC